MTNEEIAIKAVCEVTGQSKRRMLSPKRDWPAAEARQLLVLLLYHEGYNDMRISWVIGRSRGQALKSRHNAMRSKEVSRSFREKFEFVKQKYYEKKSLRIAEVGVS